MSATENGELQYKPTIVCNARRVSVTMGKPGYAAASHENLNQRADLSHDPGSPMHTRFAGAAVMTPPAGHSSLDHVNGTQLVSEMGGELPADRAACEAVPENPDTALVTQDDDHEGDQTPCRSSQMAVPVNPHRIQEQSTPTRNERSDLHSNCSVEVIIPTSQPAGPQVSKTARRPCRTGRGKRKNRSTSPKDADSDDSDDFDDDDYVDTSKTWDDSRRPIKRKRQLPAAEGDRPKSQTAARSPLGGFSLPDLDAISRGVLTCEFFPSEIMYSFSWKVDRDPSDHLRFKENPIGPTDQGRNGYEKNDAPSSVPRIVHKANKVNTPFSKEELDLLKRLKEEDRLPWKQIKEHFPGRTEGTLQVQYSTKLKDRAPRSLVSTASENKDLNDESSQPTKSGQRNCREESPRTTADPPFSSRYGPPRSRRAVDRYSLL
jgi:hypothetical protein